MKCRCGGSPWFGVPRGGFAPIGLPGFAGGFTQPPLPHKLLDLDFRFPVEQSFPQSSAKMAALGLPAPTSIYDFREAAGNVLDHVGGNDLVPFNNPIQNQPANGLWDGTDLHSVRCAETLNAGNQRFNAANNTIFDLDAATSLAFLLVFRRGTLSIPGLTRDVVGTLQLSHSSGLNPSGGEAVQASNIDTFVAGDLVGIKITTLGTFAPNTVDLEAIIGVAFVL